jgi:hypothetical protein
MFRWIEAEYTDQLVRYGSWITCGICPTLKFLTVQAQLRSCPEALRDRQSQTFEEDSSWANKFEILWTSSFSSKIAVSSHVPAPRYTFDTTVFCLFFLSFPPPNCISDPNYRAHKERVFSRQQNSGNAARATAEAELQKMLVEWNMMDFTARYFFFFFVTSRVTSCFWWLGRKWPSQVYFVINDAQDD